MVSCRVIERGGTLAKERRRGVVVGSDVSRRGAQRQQTQIRRRPLLRRLVGAGARRVRRLRTLEAKADRASVLDGSTLRVSGRVRPLFALPSEGAALELWLRARGGQALRLCAAEVQRRGRRGLTFEASASLVGGGQESLIGAETFAVYVRVPGNRLLALRAPQLEDETGPTLANPRSPQTGLWYRLRRSSIGQLSIKVKAFPAHAEVEQVREEATELVVVGRIVGATLPPPPDEAAAPPALLEFSERTTGSVQSAPARVLGHRFSAEADPERFAVPDGERYVWEMALRIPGNEPLALGRYLDDIRNPESTYHYPRVVVGADSGHATVVQPIYTGERRLALYCGPAVGEDRRS